MIVLKELQCKAEKCKHNCCVGWEIDIDKETYQKYMNLPNSKIKDKIKNSIKIEDGIYSFLLDKDYRCPFLNKDNLCEIRIELGEEYQCYICRTHPKYFCNSKSGYGLCCEAVAEQLLTNNESVSSAILFLCNSLKKNSLFYSECAFKKFSKKMSELEYIESQWFDHICDVRFVPIEQINFSSQIECAYLHLMEYLICRHNNFIYAQYIWQYLRFVSYSYYGSLMRIEDLMELCREYSSNIEYSDKNTSIINEFLGGVI